MEKREIIRNEFHDKMVETSRVRMTDNFILCSISFQVKVLCFSPVLAKLHLSFAEILLVILQFIFPLNY